MTTLDDLLDSSVLETETDFLAEEALLEQDILGDSSPVVELGDSIDPRLQNLSHSSRLTLHSCPRKYQLYRLQSKESDAEDTSQSNVTFAYGHSVGVGIQSALEGKNEDTILLDAFVAWDTELLDSNPRQKKSIWEAVFAIQKFLSVYNGGYLSEYELVYHEGKPAVELSFAITLPNGYSYRGFVDAVLRHKETGKVVVLELKTTSGTANGATYKNSGQALGYSVVLDLLFPGLSSYSVIYLVYQTRSKEYAQLEFDKTYLQRALWLQELLIDTQLVTLYESYDVYPMHGESCYDFFRECEYLGLCTLPTERLTRKLTEKMLDSMKEKESQYQFTIDFNSLVQSQLERA